MKRFLSLTMVLIIVLSVVAGCGAKDDGQVAGGNEEGKNIVIGASLLTQAHPFQVAIKDALESEAKNQGVEVNVAIADQDLNRQISAIEDFINKEVDAIILTPVDSDGVKGAILKAQDAGIPVITVDVKANGVEVDTHIATDNYTGGRIAAEAMAQYLGEAGKIGLITYPEVQSVRDRIDGFKDMTKEYEGLEIITELPGRTREEAKKASEDILTSNPDINGIFGFGDDMAIAATTVVAERNSDAVVVGFDGLEEAQKSVDADNAFKAVVVQYPDKMGEEAIKSAISIINGEEVEREIPITPGLYINGQGFVEVTIDGDKIETSVN